MKESFKKSLRIAGKVLKGILIFWLVIFLLIFIVWNVPAVHDYAVGKGIDYFNETTGGELSIGEVDLRIPYFIGINDLQLIDPGGNPLVSIEKLEAYPGWRMLFTKTIRIDEINLSGSNSKILLDEKGEFNFDFIIKGFADTASQKVTESSPWTFSFGDLNLKDFEFEYRDEITSDLISIQLGSLSLEMKELNLDKFLFDVGSIEITNSEIEAKISSSQTSKREGETSAELPWLSLGELTISDFTLDLSLDGSPAYDLEIGQLELETEEINLVQNVFILNKIALSESTFMIPLPPNDTDTIAVESNFDSEAFDLFPHQTFELSDLHLEEVNVSAMNGEKPIHQLSFQEVALEDIKVNSSTYTAAIEEFNITYNEITSPVNLQGGIAVSDKHISLKGLAIAHDQSTVNLNGNLSYENAEKVLSNFEFIDFDLDINESNISKSTFDQVADLVGVGFQPFPIERVEIDALLYGNLESIELDHLQLRSGTSSFEIKGKTTLKEDILWPKEVELKKLTVDLRNEDFAPLLARFEMDPTLIPSYLKLNANGSGTGDSLFADGTLCSPFGESKLYLKSGSWNTETIPIDLLITSDGFNYGEYLGLEQLLSSDFKLSARSENFLDSTLALHANLQIDTLLYNELSFHQIKSKVDLSGSEMDYLFSIEDTFVEAGVSGNLNFAQGLSTEFNATVSGIDLEGLKYSEKDIRGSFSLEGAFTQDSLATAFEAALDEILFVKEEERYPFQPITLKYSTDSDSTLAAIEGGFIRMHSTANRRVDSLMIILSNVLAESENRKILDQKAFWEADLEIDNLDEIGELFLPDLKKFASSSANIFMSAEKKELQINAGFPKIQYGSILLDSLFITSTDGAFSNKRTLKLEKLAYDSLYLENIYIELLRKNEGLTTLVELNHDSSANHYRLVAELEADSVLLQNGFQLRFTDDLILEGKKWEYGESCQLIVEPEGLSFENFKIHYEEKSIELIKPQIDSSFQIVATNFPLSTITGILNTEERLFRGIMDGNATLNRDGSFLGDGTVRGLNVSGADFGTLTWEASKLDGKFKTLIQDRGELVDFTLKGDFSPKNDSTSSLDFDLELNRLELHVFEEIFSAFITDAEGTMKGALKISGNTSDPDLFGDFYFQNAHLKTRNSRSKFYLQDDRIEINPDRIEFSKFRVTDENGQDLRINGSIRHKNYSDFSLGLEIKGDDFVLLDLNKSGDSPIYGKLVADINLIIEGSPYAPLVDAKVKIEGPTDFSYIVTTKAEAEAFDESLLIWTNFENDPGDEIITRKKNRDEIGGNVFATKPKINGELIISESAIFQVIVDSIAGDYLKIQGSSILDINYDRTGAFRFNGVYEVSEGFYQMTFYDIQKKKFEFLPKSKIVWNGEPTNADIDIKAAYKTRAGIANLMLTDPSATYDEAFQQQLPFLVLLNVDGKLLDPSISFGLELAEEAKGALSGSVEARLKDVRENENSLNKQVFALLVFNTFLPQEGSSDGNVLANQARNSASQILTNQLNSLSNKYIKGVDVNFDMYSYGGGTGQGNTDLNVNLAKSFADDRIVVKVGSTIAIEDNSSSSAQSSQQQFMTNIELEYKLTPDGRYRLLVFSKTDLEDIVIGRITRSGGGIVFQKDFDRFKNIFAPKDSTAIKTNKRAD